MNRKNATSNPLGLLVLTIIKITLGLFEEHKIITAIIDNRNLTRPFSHMDVVALPKKGIKRWMGMMIGENQGLVFGNVRYVLFDAIYNIEKCIRQIKRGIRQIGRGIRQLAHYKNTCFLFLCHYYQIV